jgi:polyisoprenoid-binding protein YceI
MTTRAILIGLGLVSAGLLGVAAAPSLTGTAVGARAMAASAVAAPAADTTTWKVDGVHSSVVYRVKHMGVANFWGRFNEVKGTFTFDPAAPDAATFDIEIPAESIDSNNGNRDKHLEGPDFFNVKQFPTITFKSKSVKKAGDAFELAGDLTLLGVTKPVTAKLEHIGTAETPRGPKTGFDATFTIKRSDFGMNYGVSEGALGDEVTIIVAIEGDGPKK